MVRGPPSAQARPRRASLPARELSTQIFSAALLTAAPPSRLTWATTSVTLASVACALLAGSTTDAADRERLAEIHHERASLVRQLEQLEHEEVEIRARIADRQQRSQQQAAVLQAVDVLQGALQDQPAAPSLQAAGASSSALHVELPAISSLPDLPDELSILVWRAILFMDVCSAMRLCQANKYLRSKLEPVKAEARAFWLLWGGIKQVATVLPDVSYGVVTLTSGKCEIRNNRRSVVAQGSQTWGSGGWAVGNMLPTKGKSSWKLRIDLSYKNEGSFSIGICLAGAWEDQEKSPPQLWALQLGTGRLTCRLDEARTMQEYPNGDGTQVLIDAAGQPANLQGRASGAVIVVIVDHDAGTLSFRVELKDKSKAKRNKPSRGNSQKKMGRTIDALQGLPPGAQFRPYVSVGSPGDQLSFYGSLNRPVSSISSQLSG